MSHFVISKIQTARQQQQHSKYSQYLPVQCTELWRHQAKHSADLTWINSVHLKVGCGNLRKFKLGKASSSISSLTTKSSCLRGFKPSPLFNGHLLQETGRLASLVSLESFLCPGGGLSHGVWGGPSAGSPGRFLVVVVRRFSGVPRAEGHMAPGMQWVCIWRWESSQKTY